MSSGVLEEGAERPNMTLMLTILAWGLGLIVGLAVGLTLGVWTMGSARKRRKGRGTALASAFFMADLGINTRQQSLIHETKDATARKKESGAGDPPVAG